ncbi:MAG: NADH:flavin oxidoreductase [Deltaproteobacteria bacterium]|nr:NADH:flavin oxidoreductase [Deltaproteobacteria bacterium]
MSKLFTPGKLGPLELRNRTIRSAAFEGMCPEGRPSEALVAHHRAMAAGGVGMTTVAYAAVSPDGRTFAHQMWMRPEIEDDLRRLTDAVHGEGGAAAIQMGHAGFMADRAVTGSAVLAPSRVINLYGLALPRAMTETDIEDLVAAFGRATTLARDAGFDAVEVQAGHGYLISQFLSPYTNRRKDRWGGNLEGRARLMGEVLRAVKAAAGPELAVIMKMNLRDGFDGGLEVEEAVEIARLAEREGVDGLVLSGGFSNRTPFYIMRGDVPLDDLIQGERNLLKKVGMMLFGKMVVRTYPFTDAYFLDLAEKLVGQVDVPLILVGGLKSRAVIDQVLDAGFDFVAMARALICEPDFVVRLAGVEPAVSRCEPCNRCVASMYHGEQRCPL